jgi:hypothetical protein
VKKAGGSNCNWHIGSGKIFAKNGTTLVVSTRSSDRKATKSPNPREPSPQSVPEEVVNPTDGTITITLTDASPAEAIVAVDYYDDDEPFGPTDRD